MKHAVSESNAVLIFDREILLSTTKSRTNYRYKNQSMLVSEFVARLKTPTVTPETYDQYLSLPKSEQDEIKDVGGFVGATLKNGSRRKVNVGLRSMFTLDVDFADKQFADKVRDKLGDYCYTIYSTHKHSELKPRYRLVIYPDQPMLSDQYQACARRLASDLGFHYFDHTGLDINRLMYFPSMSVDSDYYFYHNDADFIPVEKILSSYGDEDAWRDISKWPTSPAEKKDLSKRLRKQQDPLTKVGIVGSYCRTHAIRDVIANELHDVYRQEGERYTFIEGSSSNGLIIYDEKFAYSNHATDPSCGETCNAFDLLRLHKFGHMDDDTTTASDQKRPSYKAMCEYASEIPAVKRDLVQSQLEKSEALSFDVIPDDGVDDMLWLESLQTSRDGVIKPTFFNAVMILEHDPAVSGRVRFNKLSMHMERLDGELWSDTDSNKVRKYVGQKYVCNFPESYIEKSILEIAHNNSYHPIQDYLERLTWDGVNRVESVFIDYLKCDDNVYTREACKCWLVGAVNRAFHPSYKFDNVPVFGGDEGVGKSLFIEVLAKEWFGTLKTFDDKKSVEQMSGRWMVEIAELSAMSSSKIEQQKAFISETSTVLRAAYARHSTEYKRQCVFAGTTNQHEYLISRTGNRRWWPVDCGLSDSRNEVIDFKKLRDEVDQIWAEAHLMYVTGASTLLGKVAKGLAREAQEGKLMSDGEEGVIGEWLLKPADAGRYAVGYEQLTFSDGSKKDVRDKVCINEVWTDCLREPGRCKTTDRRRIGYLLDGMKNLERRGTLRFGDRFGRQRGWLIKN